MTFEQFLEGEKTWNTKNPRYDINLAADYSDDYNDASHFLIPFMRKLKAFYEYCWVAENEMKRMRWRRPPETSRRQKEPFWDDEARTIALQGIVGYHTLQRNNGGFRWLPMDLISLGGFLHDLHHDLGLWISGEGSRTDIASRFNTIDEYIDKVLNYDIDSRLNDRDRQLVEKVKDSVRRMKRFLETARPQLDRVLSLGGK